MNNPNLNTAMCDLCDAIRGVTLGSVEHAVMQGAGEALIRNWNDHNKDDQIDEAAELKEWTDEIAAAT
jgi:hypothetical protein